MNLFQIMHFSTKILTLETINLFHCTIYDLNFFIDLLIKESFIDILIDRFFDLFVYLFLF